MLSVGKLLVLGGGGGGVELDFDLGEGVDLGFSD